MWLFVSQNIQQLGASILDATSFHAGIQIHTFLHLQTWPNTSLNNS